jgi:predicted transcriptional regulator
MLYPVAPEKIAKFKDKLNAAADAENLPRPQFKALDATDEVVREMAAKFIEDPEMADPVEGFHVMRYRGRLYALVEVEWASPLYDNEGQRVFFTGNVPAGPDPMAMWQVLFLIPA